MSAEDTGGIARRVRSLLIGSRDGDAGFVVAMELSLLPFFVWLKVLLVQDDLSASAAKNPGALRLAARLGMTLHADALFVVVLGLVSFGLLRLVGRPPIARAAVRVVLVSAHAAIAAWVAGTWPVWRGVTSMVSIQLYRLSGGFGHFDPGVAGELRAAAPLLVGAFVLYLSICAVVAWWGPLSRVLRVVGRRAAWVGAAATVLVLVALAVKNRRAGIEIRDTPIVYFLSSWLQEPPDFGAGEVVSLDGAALFAPPLHTRRATPPAGRADKPRNVILLVLESVGAEYMHAFGGRWDNTPVLDAWKGSARFFTGCYAHAPMTNESAFTLQCAMYPRTGNVNTIGATPHLQLPDLAGVLHDHGYRTGFICQTLLGWQGPEFFRERHFDHYEERYEYLRDWSGTRDMNDFDLLPKAFDWIGTSTQPFFLMLWTYQGHYPHYSIERPRELEPGRPHLNRYLAAVQDDDRFIGELRRQLEERGLLDSTLLVVTADHGQTLAPTAEVRATRDLTEASVHVPLLFAGPNLGIEPGVDTAPARHIDVAPSILDLLGIDSPSEWQGASLFSGPRPKRIYFTSSYKRPTTYGLKDGDFKFVTDGVDHQLYDLSVDPGEHHNLAAREPAKSDAYYRALIAWHRFQPGYLDRFVRR